MSAAYTRLVMHAIGVFIVCDIMLARPYLLGLTMKGTTPSNLHMRTLQLWSNANLAAMGMCNHVTVGICNPCDGGHSQTM